MTHPVLPACAALALSLSAASASASCGSAYCTLMTDRYAQGTGEPHVGWSADLRLEYVRQKRLRSGTHDIDAGEVTDEEAIERETKNLNLLATLGYGFDQHWSVLLRVPAVRRDHSHDLLDEETGEPSTEERWRFTRLGDAQLLARYQAAIGEGATSLAAFGGLKLPTGSIHVANDDDVRAERALQPGSGTNDLVVGLAGRHVLGATDAAIGQIAVTQALDSREHFHPGRRIELAAGWSHAFSARLGSVVQLNYRHRERDSGAEAEPENSGATTVELSPGLTLGIGSMSTLYAYVQLPLYQDVNGIQLVPRNSFALGWTADF